MTASNAPAARERAEATRPLAERSLDALLADFDSPLPVHHIDAQDELVRRGTKAETAEAVRNVLRRASRTEGLTEKRQTWTTWTLGRIAPADTGIDREFADLAASGTLNLRIQALRILAHRTHKRAGQPPLPRVVRETLAEREPRLRFAAVQAIHRARDVESVPALLRMLGGESDRVTFYAGWQALRDLVPIEQRKAMLRDERAGVRRGALLSLAEDLALKSEEVQPFLTDADAGVRMVAGLRLGKIASRTGVTKGTPPIAIAELASTGEAGVASIQVASSHRYQVIDRGLVVGAPVYTDRAYTFTEIPAELAGAAIVRTANEDAGSRRPDFLTLDTVVPATVWFGHDVRIRETPAWLRLEGPEAFERSALRIRTSDATFALFRRRFGPGRIVLGGNTDDGEPNGHSNALVIVQPAPFAKLDRSTTVDEALPLVKSGDTARGRALFLAATGAACSTCHRVKPGERGFGPNLSHLAPKNDPKHIVQSILEPSTFLTEGFATQVLELTDGRVITGLLREETAEAITLAQPDGSNALVRVSDIEERRTLRVSAMPPFDRLLGPQQVADLAAFLLAQPAPAAPSPATPSKPQAGSPAPPKSEEIRAGDFDFRKGEGQLEILLEGRPLATYIFADKEITRPYFAHVREPGGVQVTRNHPPKPDDVQDHASFHPGLFLAFGDLSGSDSWRLKARVVHDGFIAQPAGENGRAQFTVRNRYLAADGRTTVCRETGRYTLIRRPAGVLLDWDSTFDSEQPFAFGDQEEMGLGVRVASAIREKGGNGRITTSEGRVGADRTWGQPAAWSDYSGTIDGRHVGITVMASPDNLRPSWWHNRDYGLSVANLFGRSAMRQGAASRIEVKPGEKFRLHYGIVLHGAADAKSYDPAAEYAAWLEAVKAERAPK